MDIDICIAGSDYDFVRSMGSDKRPVRCSVEDEVDQLSGQPEVGEDQAGMEDVARREDRRGWRTHWRGRCMNKIVRGLML